MVKHIVAFKLTGSDEERREVALSKAFYRRRKLRNGLR